LLFLLKRILFFMCNFKLSTELLRHKYPYPIYMKADFIRKFSLHPGDYENLDSYEQRRYLTFFFFITLSVIIMFLRMFLITFLTKLDYDAEVLLINSLPFVICLIVSFITNAGNYRKMLIASFLLIPAVLSICHYYTADESIEFFILSYIVLAFFFFNKPVELIAAFLYNTIHFISLISRDYFYLSSKMKIIPYDGLLDVYNVVAGMLFTYLAFYIVKVQSWRYENILAERAREMEQLNYTKDKIFSTIAHDLKSPMAANLTLLKQLEKNTDIPLEEYRCYISEIRASVDETNNLVFDMLTWAKNEMQKTEPVITKVYVQELAAEIIKEVYKKAEEKRIELVCNINDDQFVYADRQSLKIVLRNLLTNALKFTASGGHVRLETVWNKDKFEIIVADNGIGMCVEKLKHITTGNMITTNGTNKETGTGLGLLICHSLIKKSNAVLKIYSQENVGTSVKLCFPYFAVAN
jgi:two-component system, sensor histidine kinase and response regulator